MFFHCKKSLKKTDKEKWLKKKEGWNHQIPTSSEATESRRLHRKHFRDLWEAQTDFGGLGTDGVPFNRTDRCHHGSDAGHRGLTSGVRFFSMATLTALAWELLRASWAFVDLRSNRSWTPRKSGKSLRFLSYQNKKSETFPTELSKVTWSGQNTHEMTKCGHFSVLPHQFNWNSCKYHSKNQLRLLMSSKIHQNSIGNLVTRIPSKVKKSLCCLWSVSVHGSPEMRATDKQKLQETSTPPKFNPEKWCLEDNSFPFRMVVYFQVTATCPSHLLIQIESITTSIGSSFHRWFTMNPSKVCIASGDQSWRSARIYFCVHCLPLSISRKIMFCILINKLANQNMIDQYYILYHIVW